jgi:hypothetical protein
MLTLNNDKLKTIIFHLLKKDVEKGCAFKWKYNDKIVEICYPFHPYVPVSIDQPCKESDEWKININLYQYDDRGTYSYFFGQDVDLTEREAMEIKWKLDDINDAMKQTLFDELADFALEEKGTQDELIED